MYLFYTTLIISADLHAVHNFTAFLVNLFFLVARKTSILKKRKQKMGVSRAKNQRRI